MSRRGRGRAAVHAPGDGRAPFRQWWVRREGCRTARPAPASDPRRKSSRRHRRRCLHPVADRAMTTALKTRIDPASAYHEPARGDVGVLCLDLNEGRLPSPAALAELAEADPELLRRYPDVSELTALLAAQWRVAAGRVLVTAGADEAIDRIFRAFLTRGRTLLLPEPSFEMLDRYAALADGELVRVPWPDAAFPTDEFLERVDARTAVIAIVSPNNPTGGVATLADVRRIAEHAPDALVLLDHAYVEYADDDLTAAVLDVPNVVVVRTLSKAWGLAGCRVGYAIGSPDIIPLLRHPSRSPCASSSAARHCSRRTSRACVKSARRSRGSSSRWDSPRGTRRQTSCSSNAATATGGARGFAQPRSRRSACWCANSGTGQVSTRRCASPCPVS